MNLDYWFKKGSRIKEIEKCLLRHADREQLRPIGDIIKTQGEFLNNYSKHDIATQIILQKLKESFQLGGDLRGVRGQMENECPDYYYKADRIFAYDIKAKSSTDFFGWCNERAYESYKKVAMDCNCQVYLIYCLITEVKPYTFLNRIGHSNIGEEAIDKKSSEEVHNGNPVVILRWEEGSP